MAISIKVVANLVLFFKNLHRAPQAVIPLPYPQGQIHKKTYPHKISPSSFNKNFFVSFKRLSLSFITTYSNLCSSAITRIAETIANVRSEEHTSELQSQSKLVC